MTLPTPVNFAPDGWYIGMRRRFCREAVVYSLPRCCGIVLGICWTYVSETSRGQE